MLRTATTAILVLTNPERNQILDFKVSLVVWLSVVLFKV